MKKLIFLLFIIIPCHAFSQINSPNGNNIFMYNGLADVIFRFPERGSGGRALVHYPSNILSINYGSDFTGGTLIGNDVYFKDGGNSYIASGNFGIGTSSPLTKLDVRGHISVWGTGNAEEHGEINFENSNHGIRRLGNIVDVFTAGGIESGITFTNRVYNASTNSYSNMLVALKIASDGNVGIGTINPTSKLTVAGDIHAREVRVTLNAGAVPDYVFANDYKLKSLQEVEDYIKQNSHLPEIPSAKEIEKNGLMLAEMNMSLLKKIEEMTLYMIEQNKRINKMEIENSLLKNQMKLQQTISEINNVKQK